MNLIELELLDRIRRPGYVNMIINIYCWRASVWDDAIVRVLKHWHYIKYIIFLTQLKLLLLYLNFCKVPSILKCYKISALFTLINDTLSEWWILLECNLKDNIILGRKKSSSKNLEQLPDEILTIMECSEGCGGIWKCWQ